MNAPILTKRFSFDDFCTLVKDGQKADLIDGVIYMASPDNTDAGRLLGWLHLLVGGFVEEKDLGDVFLNRIAYKLDQYNSPEPDLSFVRKSRVSAIQRGHVNGPPDLAVEIVSPESVERDYEKKRRLYEEASVREYWIVDEVQQEVSFFRRLRHQFREVEPVRGKYQSRVLPGFWFRADWFWQSPRPRVSRILKQILANPGGK